MKGPLADISTVNFGKRGAEQAPRFVPALTLVSHPVFRRAGERLLLEALGAGNAVPLSRMEPDFARPGGGAEQPLADPAISRKPLIFLPGKGGGVRLRVDAGGTSVSVEGTPLQGEREFGPEELAAGVPLELSERIVLLLHRVEVEAEGPSEALGMVGESAGIRHVRQQIQHIADLDVPVLIRGETGTGKERVAQAIHQRSHRREGRFVSVNLGAIPKELAAAELFGAKRGAYTGAAQEREGFFRAAQGGTLFLDEVGEAPPEVQVLLLRVLETGELYPVGGQTPVKLDVRLVAATDADLEAQIHEGRFRAPLLHRLAGYEIVLPPLRERREDMGLLFAHFAREELQALGEVDRLSPEAPAAEPWMPAALATRLVRYSWPGNIRQLRNVVRQLIISSRGRPSLRVEPRLARELGMSEPSPSPSPSLPSRPVAAPAAPVPRRKASDVTEQELLTALRECAWDFQAVADRLGILRSSIYVLIDKNPHLHLRTAGDLTPEEITRCFHECGGDLDAMVQRLEVSKRALKRRVKELGLEADEAG